jgi:hypothetical protein
MKNDVAGPAPNKCKLKFIQILNISGFDCLFDKGNFDFGMLHLCVSFG